MRKKSYIYSGLVILVAILTIMSIFPIATSATLTTGVLITGAVTVNGHSLNPQDNAIVTAVIPGTDGFWSKEVTFFNGESRFVQLLIPMNTGTVSKNGGVDGDIIYFFININGVMYLDTETEKWMQGRQLQHSIHLSENHYYYEIIITTDSLEPAQVGMNYSQDVEAEGGFLPYEWSWEAQAGSELPPGLDLSADGTISGTPGAAGTYALTMLVTDVLGVQGSKDFNLVVSNPVDTLQITTESLVPAELAVPYSMQLEAAHGTMPYEWSWESQAGSELPPGLDFSADGSISGTPGDIGTYALTITVTDALDVQANKDFNLVVSNPGEILQIITDSLDPAETGVPYTMILEAIHGMIPYEWSWEAQADSELPPGLELSADGTISGTPVAAGIYHLIVTITDALGIQDSKEFDLVVSIPGELIINNIELARWVTEVWPADPPPSWGERPMPGWIIGKPYTDNMTAFGGNGDYHWSATGLPSGLELADNGAISGTPDTAGEYAIDFTAIDSSDPVNTGHKTLNLKIYLLGDANGSGLVTIGDAAYTDSANLGLQPATAGCDADLDGLITVADAAEIIKIIYGP